MRPTTSAIILTIWSAGIVVMSIMPVTVQSVHFFEHEDKLVHAFIYAVQCILLLEFLKKDSGHHYIKAIILSSGFGCLMEILQAGLNTGRHFDYFDIIANIIGSLIGSLLFYLFSKNNQNG